MAFVSKLPVICKWRFQRGFRCGEVGEVRGFMQHGAGANFNFVLAGFVAAWGVDDKVDITVFHHINVVRALFYGEFIVGLNVDAFDLDSLKITAGGVDLETEFGDLDSAFFLAVVTAEEDVTLLRKRVEGWALA